MLDLFELEKIVIRSYYEDVIKDNLLIVGLNDDRGYNFQKSCLTYLKEYLKSDKYNIDVYNGFSMFFNKMRHIDYYLDNNISMYEMELIQKYATIDEIKHALGDSKLANKLGNIGSKIFLKTYEDRSDKKIFRISSSIKNSTQPIIVYSSGINDIMSEFWINPLSVKNCYYKEKENYQYSLNKTKGENRIICMNRLMDGHKNNIERLLSLNSKSKILTLGAYLYSKDKKYSLPFHDFVLEYNEKLKNLCKEYNIQYVDLRFIEKTRYCGIFQTYFNNVSRLISKKLIDSLFQSLKLEEVEISNKYNYKNDGVEGMLENMVNFRINFMKNDKDEYEMRKQEYEREENVLKKVIKEV